MSGNGINLQATNNELIKVFRSIRSRKSHRSLIDTSVEEWKFIHSGSPWMRGAQESLVKISKRPLKTVTIKQPVYEEQLRTILVEVEGTLNSCPLTSVSDYINEIYTFIPNYSLTGRPIPNPFMHNVVKWPNIL